MPSYHNNRQHEAEEGSSSAGSSSLPSPSQTIASSGGADISTSSSSIIIRQHQQQRDEMVSAENAGLRERVAELERKVQAQEDELVCLRSSTADVLRRLNLIEKSSNNNYTGNNLPASSSNVFTRLSSPGYTTAPPSTTTTRSIRSLSQSSTNLRAPPVANGRTNSPIFTHRSSFDDEPTNNHEQPRQRATTSTTPRRYQRARMVNIPMGRSARGSPLRKSLSTLDMQDSVVSSSSSSNNNGGAVALAIAAARAAGSSPARTTNMRTVASRFGGSSSSISMSLRSIAHIGNKDPIYYADQRMLQVFLHGRPYSVYPPSHVTTNTDTLLADVDAPKTKLALEWVHGYRGRDCRANLHYLPTGELLYFTAAIVVLHNVDDGTQRHYTQHTSDVKCIAVHPNKLLVASGQSSRHAGDRKVSEHRNPITSPNELGIVLESDETEAHVRIWDSITLQTTHIIGVGEGSFERSISCIAFSKVDGGALLAVIDDSYEHTLSIWDWQRRKRITDIKSANDQVFSCEFHPIERHLLVVCGKCHFNFWQFDGILLQKRPTIYDARDKPKYVLCVCFSEAGDILSGDSNGTISVWDTRSARVLRQLNRVHRGGVFTLCTLRGGRVLSGGKDRSIIEWNVADMSKTAGPIQIAETAGTLRTIAPASGGLIVIGTTTNCILQGDMRTGFRYIVQGHNDEVWGLCAHPSQQQFLTTGHDKLLKFWDGTSRSLIWTKEIAEGIQCVCFHPNGSVIAIGTTNGRWHAFDTTSRELLPVGFKEGAEPITAIAYSPDGRMLAVGTRDAQLSLYTVSDGGHRYGRTAVCSGHSMALSAIDWSIDGLTLRSCGADYEMLTWSGSTGKIISDVSRLRDVDWATNTCPLAYESVCAYAALNTSGKEVTSCDRATSRQLMAMATDAGGVALFGNPCTSIRAKCCETTIHGSAIASVKFLANGARIVSISAKDMTVMQWTIGKQY